MKAFWFCMACLVNIGWAQTGKSDEVLFTVGSYPTSVQEFMYLYKKNNKTDKEKPTLKSLDDYLGLIIQFKQKIAEARRLGLDTTKTYQKEFLEYREELRRPYTTEKDRVEKFAQEAYERMKWEIRAAHILLAVAQDAKPADTLAVYNRLMALAERVKKGEKFDVLAEQYSEDPSAKSNRGDLGYFTSMQMVYPFESAAYALQVGELSPIVRTRFGYHLILLLDKRAARGEVEVSHIMIRHEGNTDTKRLQDALSELKNGKKWEDVCKQYSEDPTTKDNGGKLRPFSAGMMSAFPSFEEAAFALTNPNDISPIVETSIGWHLIRLNKKTPLKPYSDLAQGLKQKISRDERLKISDENAFKKMKKEFAFEEKSDVLEKLLASADSSLLKGKWRFKGDKQLSAQTVCLLQQQPYSVGDVVRFMQHHQETGFGSPRSYMLFLYDSFVRDKINDLEEKKVAQTNPDFLFLLKEYKEGILLFNLMDKEIWHAASTDTVGLKNYYEKNASKYTMTEGVEARLMKVKNQHELERLKTKILKHDTLSTQDMQSVVSISDFQLYERAQHKVLKNVQALPGVHFPTVDGDYYIVEIKRLVDAGTKPFSMARPAVISDYQQELEKNWLQTLAKRFPSSIQTKTWKQVQKKLLQKSSS